MFNMEFETAMLSKYWLTPAETFAPWYHRGVLVLHTSTMYRIESIHWPKNDDMFGFKGFGEPMPGGGADANMRISLVPADGGAVVVITRDELRLFTPTTVLKPGCVAVTASLRDGEEISGVSVLASPTQYEVTKAARLPRRRATPAPVELHAAA